MTLIWHPSLAFITVGSADTKLYSVSKMKEPFQRSFRLTTLISDKQFSEASGMVHLRKTLCLTEILQTAYQLIIGSHLHLVMNQPGESELASVVENNQVYFTMI